MEEPVGDFPFSDRQFYVYLALALSLPITHFYFGKSRKPTASLLLFAMCLLWFVWCVALGLQSEIRFRDAFVGLLSYCSILFVALSELLMSGGATWLTKRRGENWVKEIDYLYLGLGAVGLFISLGQLASVSDKLSLPGTIGPVALATALTLRIVKTRAEIGGWNKLPIVATDNAPTVASSH